MGATSTTNVDSAPYIEIVLYVESELYLEGRIYFRNIRKLREWALMKSKSKCDNNDDDKHDDIDITTKQQKVKWREYHAKKYVLPFVNFYFVTCIYTI